MTLKLKYIDYKKIKDMKTLKNYNHFLNENTGTADQLAYNAGKRFFKEKLYSCSYKAKRTDSENLYWIPDIEKVPPQELETKNLPYDEIFNLRNKMLFRENTRLKYLGIDYPEIWSKIEKIYGLDYNEIVKLTEEVLDEEGFEGYVTGIDNVSNGFNTPELMKKLGREV